MIPPIKPGDVLRLNEADYMYGAGTLIIRVIKVGRVQNLRDGEWLDLEGVELRQDDSQYGRKPRHLHARVTALRAAIQP
jgi:hypothetical protein